MTQGLTDGEEIVVKIEEIKTLSGNTPTTQGSVFAWNQKGGVSASSTRNMTGVYDLSGGLWERTASYVANAHEHLQKYGASVAYSRDVLKIVSTKYTMVYPHDDTIDTVNNEDNLTNLDVASNANYIKNTKIYGDAIREISMDGISNSSWEDDYSMFSGSFTPFVVWGGGFWYKSHAGSFSSYRARGNSDYSHGFRTIVVPNM